MRTKTIAALLLGLLVLAGACSGSDDEESDAGAGGEAASFETEGGGVEESEAALDAPAAPVGDGQSALGPRQVGDAGRLLRREATIVVEVDDLTASVEVAVQATADAGGYLSSEQTDRFTSQIVLRVPSDRFDQTLDQLATLGKIERQEVTTDDRTDVIVDLEARLATAEASLARTRTFFDEARNVDDLTLLEREVAERESLVASLQAALDNERSSVALSTITVTFALDRNDLPDELLDEDDPLPGVSDALGNGWSALVSLGYVIALAIAWILPWLPLVFLVGFALRWFARRRTRRRAERPPSASTSPQPPPPPVAPQPAAVAVPQPPTREGSGPSGEEGR